MSVSSSSPPSTSSALSPEIPATAEIRPLPTAPAFLETAPSRDKERDHTKGPGAFPPPVLQVASVVVNLPPIPQPLFDQNSRPQTAPSSDSLTYDVDEEVISKVFKLFEEIYGHVTAADLPIVFRALGLTINFSV